MGFVPTAAGAATVMWALPLHCVLYTDVLYTDLLYTDVLYTDVLYTAVLYTIHYVSNLTLCTVK